MAVGSAWRRRGGGAVELGDGVGAVVIYGGLAEAVDVRRFPAARLEGDP